MILQQSFFNYNNNISRFTLSRLGWTTQTRTSDEIWTQDRIFSGRLRVPCHSGIKITKLPNKSDCSCLRRSIADEMESLVVVIPRRMEIEEFENQKNRNSLIPIQLEPCLKPCCHLCLMPKTGKTTEICQISSRFKNQRRENDEHSYLYSALVCLNYLETQ